MGFATYQRLCNFENRAYLVCFSRFCCGLFKAPSKSFMLLVRDERVTVMRALKSALDCLVPCGSIQFLPSCPCISDIWSVMLRSYDDSVSIAVLRARTVTEVGTQWPSCKTRISLFGMVHDVIGPIAPIIKMCEFYSADGILIILQYDRHSGCIRIRKFTRYA